MEWRDALRELTLSMFPITATPHRFNVRLAGSTTTQTVTLGGEQTLRLRLRL
jgi:hypothetical protein